LQTLETIYGLVQNMSVVMDGEQMHSAYYSLVVNCRPLQTVMHPLKMAGRSLVRFVSSKKLAP
jgi:hypothetical protein